MMRQVVKVCAWCQKVETKQGQWRVVTCARHAHISHTACPSCAEQTIGEILREIA